MQHALLALMTLRFKVIYFRLLDHPEDMRVAVAIIARLHFR